MLHFLLIILVALAIWSMLGPVAKGWLAVAAVLGVVALVGGVIGGILFSTQGLPTFLLAVAAGVIGAPVALILANRR